MNARISLPAVLLAIVFATPLLAQTPPKQPVPVRVSVGDVTDNRTTGSFNSECKLELKFTGDAATDAVSVRKVRLKKAVDELGRDLARDDASDPFGSSGFGQRSGGLKTELRLRNPSRNATVIKLLSGEVELFNPTQANGSILTIKDILKHPAEPVPNSSLKKYGIELLYLTKESYEAKKKQIEEQQKSQPGAQIGDVFGDLFKGMFGGMMSVDKNNSLKLYVKDPEKRVVEVEFQDAAGKPLKRVSTWSSGELRQIELSSPPPADTQLTVHLATPEALQTFPFAIENIPLP
ncbi:MAG TPA: hypothetical protein VN578_06115 [Candidatus Binatia bacterium]|jgi:hypothetical protein|nr:hypothetical protein [Candidatus Binatia bacterium]